MTPIISVFSKQFPANVLEQLYASILISLFILSSANHYYYSSNRNCQKAFAYCSYFSSWSTFLPHKLLLKKYNCQQVFVWSWSSDIYSLTLTEISRINYFQQTACTQQQQQPFYGPLSRITRVSRYQKKHSPTHHPDHHPIFISFFHLPRSIASSLFKLRAWQSFCTTFSMSSLVYLLVWSPPPHIPYISSPNHCLLFAQHAHTIATCFAVISIL